jgi:hypothetical protein
MSRGTFAAQLHSRKGGPGRCARRRGRRAGACRRRRALGDRLPSHAFCSPITCHPKPMTKQCARAGVPPHAASLWHCIYASIVERPAGEASGGTRRETAWLSETVPVSTTGDGSNKTIMGRSGPQRWLKRRYA